MLVPCSVTYENGCFPSIVLFFVTMASVKYGIQERTFLLREEFEQEYPNRGSPTRRTIYNMDRKFKLTSSVGDALVAVVREMLAPKKMFVLVAQAVVEELTRSTRCGAPQLGLSRLVLHNKNLVMQKSGTFFSECKFG